MEKYYRTAEEFTDDRKCTLGGILPRDWVDLHEVMSGFAEQYGRYKLDMFLQVCKSADIDLSAIPDSLKRYPEFTDNVPLTEKEKELFTKQAAEYERT